VTLPTKEQLELALDEPFTEHYQNVLREHERREDLRAKPAVDAIALVITDAIRRTERFHAGKCLKRPQFDCVRGVRISINGCEAGSTYLWHDKARDGLVRAATNGLAGAIQSVKNQHYHALFDARTTRLLNERLARELKAHIAEWERGGLPAQWVAYDDGSVVPPGDVKGKAKGR